MMKLLLEYLKFRYETSRAFYEKVLKYDMDRKVKYFEKGFRKRKLTDYEMASEIKRMGLDQIVSVKNGKLYV